MKAFFLRFYITLFLCNLAVCLFASTKPNVVASTSMIADIAQNIAGAEVQISCLLPIGSDPHLHEPTPKDARLVQGANLIFLNGLTLEGWMTELIQNSGSKAKSVIVTDGINAIRSEKFHNATDPHAWMDARNGIVYAENIKNALVALMPTSKSVFETNFQNYKTKLLELDSFIKAEIQKIPAQKRILITSHDAFHYYGKSYGLQLESVLGTSTEADVQTSDIIRINNLVKQKGIPAVFIESTINPKLLNQIATDNGIKIGGKLFADSLGDAESGADTYLKMLKQNTVTIAEALINASDTTTKEESKRGSMRYILLGLLILLPIILVILFFLNKNKM